MSAYFATEETVVSVNTGVVALDVPDACPAGELKGVTVVVDEDVTGCEGFHVGTPTTHVQWGTNIPVSAGTQTTHANFQPGSVKLNPTATAVRLTAVGGKFTGGVIRVQAHYVPI